MKAIEIPQSLKTVLRRLRLSPMLATLPDRVAYARSKKLTELQLLELVLQDGYDHFISVVAEGRSLPREKVEELAQGKVYSGSSAREIGLVDKLGSLEQTIEAAAERAGLADYQVTTLLPPLSWQDRILHRLGAESRALAAKISVLQPLFKSAAPALSTGAPISCG